MIDELNLACRGRPPIEMMSLMYTIVFQYETYYIMRFPILKLDIITWLQYVRLRVTPPEYPCMNTRRQLDWKRQTCEHACVYSESIRYMHPTTGRRDRV